MASLSRPQPPPGPSLLGHSLPGERHAPVLRHRRHPGRKVGPEAPCGRRRRQPRTAFRRNPQGPALEGDRGKDQARRVPRRRWPAQGDGAGPRAPAAGIPFPGPFLQSRQGSGPSIPHSRDDGISGRGGGPARGRGRTLRHGADGDHQQPPHPPEGRPLGPREGHPRQRRKDPAPGRRRARRGAHPGELRQIRPGQLPAQLHRPARGPGTGLCGHPVLAHA